MRSSWPGQASLAWGYRCAVDVVAQPTARAEILFVCTGNICRSPMAERLAAAILDRSLGPAAARIRLCSAGTQALEGYPIHPLAARVIRARGANPASFRARALAVTHLLSADLILSADRAHRAAVATLDPTVLGRCFTLREFSRLADTVHAAGLGSDPVDRLRSLVVRVAGRRGRVPPPSSALDDDIDDPFGRSVADYEECGDLISTALADPLRLLAG